LAVSPRSEGSSGVAGGRGGRRGWVRPSRSPTTKRRGVSVSDVRREWPCLPWCRR
jgi:hypothetical protein